ncbi:MAG: hypothetical protein KY442_08365 [Proteobacteria bacterium]|nr:hypothetical protein [Pseudomonadota bacterium]
MLAALTGEEPFDYLFSIFNFQKLPDEIVSAARCLPINYHDAPLPRYAGSHATSWALMNGETEHAVTWHVLTDRVDAGDILLQAPVDIDPGETALTLNAKCFEAAIDSFAALLDDLEAGTLDPRPQDRTQRTFYRRGQRPAAGGALRFDAPAAELCALVRGLDFGPYHNPLGLPKIALGETFAIVTRLDVLGDRSVHPPGTVAAITDEHLVVATATHDVALSGFLTIDGTPLPLTELVAQGGPGVGVRMTPLDDGASARLASLCTGLSQHEPFWMAQLAQARPTALPHRPRTGGASGPIASHVLNFGSGFQRNQIAGCERGGDGLLVAFLTYLAQLTGEDAIDVALTCTQRHAGIDTVPSLVSTSVPLRVGGAQPDLHQRMRSWCEQLQQVLAKASYVRDAPLRDPVLRARLDSVDPSSWPIGVEVLDDVGSAPAALPRPGRVLTARFASDGTCCTWLYDTGALEPALVERMAREFVVFLNELPAPAEPPMRTALAYSRAGEPHKTSNRSERR